MAGLNETEQSRTSDKGFAAFLESKTKSTISATTFKTDWNGVQAIRVEQGNDAFDSPPLESHFVALAQRGHGIADIAFDAHTGPNRSIVEPGVLCFMPAGHKTAFEMLGRAEMTHVLIKDNMMQSAKRLADQGDPDLIEMHGFSGRHHHAIAETMRKITEGTRTGGALWADTIALELSRQLVGFVGKPTDPNGPHIDLTDLQFGHAIDYIEANMTQDFSLSDISNAVGVLPEHMARGFVTEAGLSIETFRTERRIGIVQNWIKYDKVPQDTDVMARRVGFANAKALDTAFRTYLGISVANYRNGRLG